MSWIILLFGYLFCHILGSTHQNTVETKSISDDQITVLKTPSDIILRRLRRSFAEHYTYILGRRSSEDRILLRGTKYTTYDLIQTVSIKAAYSNQYITITYVEIEIDHSGEAIEFDLINGGLGQDNIDITAKVVNTKLVGYTYLIYGH